VRHFDAGRELKPPEKPMSENDDRGPEINIDPKVVTGFVQRLISPLIFAGIAYAVSGSGDIAFIAFVVVASLSFFGARKLRQGQTVSTAGSEQTAAATAAISSDNAPDAAVAALKRKLERLRETGSTEELGSNDDSDKLVERVGRVDREEELRIKEAARDDRTTEAWLNQFRALDQQVAMGQIDDVEYERMHRRILQAREKLIGSFK